MPRIVLYWLQIISILHQRHKAKPAILQDKNVFNLCKLTEITSHAISRGFVPGQTSNKEFL